MNMTPYSGVNTTKLKKCGYLPTCIFLLFAGLGSLKAQSLPQVIPGTPEAASLAKMINYPVSYNTGVPDISIPIYTIVVKGVSIPIILSYHASGIHVNEQSTWVGLGWDISLEPEISQSINGMNDLTGGYLNNSHINTYTGTRSLSSETSSYWNDLSNGLYDEQPDRFNYRLLTGSGSFMYQKYSDNSYTALPIPFKPLKINYNSTNHAFEVIDERGSDYLFDKSEVCTPNETVSQSYTNSWKCSQVISPSKHDTVFFNYNNYRNVYTYSHAEHVDVIDSAQGGYGVGLPQPTMCNYNSVSLTSNLSVYPGAGEGGVYSWEPYTDGGLQFYHFINRNGLSSNAGIIYNPLTINPSQQYIETGTTNVTLKEIKFRGGDLQIYSVDNNSSGSKLDSIKIFDANNKLVKTIKFCMSYFNPLRNPAAISLNDNRLRLDSLIFSSAGKTQEKYMFQYNYPSTPVDPWIKQSDAWGYYQVGSDYGDSGISVPFFTNVSFVDNSFVWGLNGNSQNARFTATVGGCSKTANEDAMKYFVLTDIINPLGGKTEFTYAANKYMDNGTLKAAGGLRIERISIYNKATDVNTSLEKIYKYGVNENGAGELKISPGLSSYVYQQTRQGFCDQNATDIERKRTFTNHSMEDLFYSNGNAVNYTQVTEYKKDMGVVTGKTMYNYSSFAANTVGPTLVKNSTHYPNTDITISKIDLEGGSLFSTTQYLYNNGQYTWIRADSNIYSLYLRPDKIHIGKIFRTFIYGPAVSQSLQLTYLNYIYTSYAQEVGANLLTGQLTSTRELSNLNTIVTKTTNYYYDNPAHLQPTRIETTKSDGSIETSITTYPLDYGTGTSFIDNMNASNLVVYPIEQLKYLDKGSGKTVISGSITQYQTAGNGLADKISSLETSSPIPISNFKISNRLTGILPPSGAATSFVADNHYVQRLAFKYDNRDNPLVITPTSGASIAYQWGYNQKFPVAEVKNATDGQFYFQSFEDLNTAIIGIAHTGVKYTTSPSINWTVPDTRSYVISYWYFTGGIWKFSGLSAYIGPTYTMTGGTAYDDIRIYPADAQMTTYTYDPLVGMTSSTDAKGEVTYYEYDSMQRLMNIKDKNGNVIKHTTYHYQGQ